MKIKTSELTGAQLDWAVAKALDEKVVSKNGRPAIEEEFNPEGPAHEFCQKEWKMWTYFQPSTDWRQGGLIIEREKITLIPSEGKGTFAGNPGGSIRWLARCKNMPVNEIGTTPLIAAMRAFVASKMGDDVEVPEVQL